MRGYFVVCKFCKRLACRSRIEERTSTDWWFEFGRTEKWVSHMQNHHKVIEPEEDTKFNVCNYEAYI